MAAEKIDGTNIRVHLRKDGSVSYNGRTDNAQLHAALWDWLHTRLPADVVRPAFDAETEAVLFGEGYGPKIQSGGTYRKDVSFRLFDVAVIAPDRIWWLAYGDVCDVAEKVGVDEVPMLANCVSLEEAAALVKGQSVTASQDGGPGGLHEGIVARTEPLLLTRRGDRVVWKLKVRDFASEQPPAGPQEGP